MFLGALVGLAVVAGTTTARAQGVVKVDLTSATVAPSLPNWNLLRPNSTIGSGSVVLSTGSVLPGVSVSMNGTAAADDPNTANWPGFGIDPYYIPPAWQLIYTVNSGLGLLGQPYEMNASFAGLDPNKAYNVRLYF